MSTLYDLAANAVRWIYDRRLSGPPVFDAAAYSPEVQDVAAAWPALRGEALALARDLKRVPRFHDLMPAQAEISANDDRDWRIFVLKAYGTDVPEHMAGCPALASLLASHPAILSAAYSFLAPGKHIPPHRGPFRGVTRFYMGLSVPVRADGTPAVVLTLEGREHRIGDGEYLVWDDTFTHEVRNDSDQVRIALLLDIRRRGMPPDMALFSRAIVAGVGAAVRLRGVRWRP